MSWIAWMVAGYYLHMAFTEFSEDEMVQGWLSLCIVACQVVVGVGLERLP